MLSQPSQIAAFRVRVLRQALQLEIKGLKRRGRSAYVIIKEEFNLRGSRQSVLDQLTEIIGEKDVNEAN